MHTHVFHSRTVILLSDLDCAALNNEHILLMRWHLTRVSSKRDRSIISSPAQKHVWVGKYVWVELWVGLKLIILIEFGK